MIIWQSILEALESLSSNKMRSGLTIIGRHARAPVSGTWAEGDAVYYTGIEPGHEIGAVCIRAGSPGVWKAVDSWAP
jgi:hypothetical protein